MDTIFGLPAHPLLVHTPVVFGPLTFLAVVVLALRPSWRSRYAAALIALCAVLLVSVFLATWSGTPLAEAVEGLVPYERHQDLGEATRLLVVVQFLAVCGWMLLARKARGVSAARSARSSWARPASHVAAAVTVALSVLQVVWMIRTAHAGAELVWDGVM